jgi:hypothetical protein
MTERKGKSQGRVQKGAGGVGGREAQFRPDNWLRTTIEQRIAYLESFLELEPYFETMNEAIAELRGVCRRCGGTGEVDGRVCPDCQFRLEELLELPHRTGLGGDRGVGEIGTTDMGGRDSRGGASSWSWWKRRPLIDNEGLGLEDGNDFA